jgi:hypothetical protein
MPEQATLGATAKPEGTIALPEIATRAMEVADLVRAFAAKLADDAEIKAIIQLLPNTATLIDAEASLPAQLVQQHPTLDSLETKACA